MTVGGVFVDVCQLGCANAQSYAIIHVWFSSPRGNTDSEPSNHQQIEQEAIQFSL